MCSPDHSKSFLTPRLFFACQRPHPGQVVRYRYLRPVPSAIVAVRQCETISMEADHRIAMPGSKIGDRFVEPVLNAEKKKPPDLRCEPGA